MDECTMLKHSLRLVSIYIEIRLQNSLPVTIFLNFYFFNLFHVFIDLYFPFPHTLLKDHDCYIPRRKHAPLWL